MLNSLLTRHAARAAVLSVLFCCVLAACVPQQNNLFPGSQPAGVSPDEWVRSLAGQTAMEQARRAEQVWRDPASPQDLRDRAAILLSTRPSSQALAAQQAVSRTYAQAAPAQKAAMERTLMTDLRTTDNGTLRLLGGSVPRSQESVFPWSLIVWQAASKQLLTDSPGALARLSAPGLFADPSVVGQAASPVSTGSPVPGTSFVPDTGMATSGPSSALHSGHVGLLLPMGGQFASIGRQVADGASIAAKVLSAKGVQMDVRVINTDMPDWPDQVAALPPEYVVVGGPLRADVFEKLRGQSMGARAVFAFMAQLPNSADEGVTVWRFFTSQQDQIDAVMNFAANEQGVNSFGVFSQGDAYGNRMSDLFLQTVKQRGYTAKTGTYSTDMASWTKASGDFVESVSTERGKIPQARASFGAIFLPDSWKNMDMLISTLNYHGAYRKIMLGTGLWEQSLNSAKGLNPATFALTVFPGDWNAKAPGNGPAQLIAGMGERKSVAGSWSVLGYDFVMLASGLNLDSTQWNAASLNAQLNAGFHLEWAGAPMTWDAQGKAHRTLFLFQPSRNGMVPLDHEAFQRYRAGSGPLPNASQAEAAAAAAAAAPAQSGQRDDFDALVNSVVGGTSDKPATPATNAAPAPASKPAAMQPPAVPAPAPAPAARPVASAVNAAPVPASKPAAMQPPMASAPAPAARGPVTQPPSAPVPIPASISTPSR